MPRIVQNISNSSVAGLLSDRSSASGSVNNSGSISEWWSEAETKLFASWASSFENYSNSFNNPYFEYFYTGQDIQITIDGLNGSDDILPIYSFGYNIQQQKTPLYGFWDYTYAAMLRGTRIVTGAFSIVSMGPYFLTSKIAKAADLRAITNSQNMHTIRGLEEDQANISKFWDKNFTDNSRDPGQKHIFSSHPPFNFVVQYGLQDTSLTTQNPGMRALEIRNSFNENDALMADTNERLVKHPIPELDKRILLENIELISKSVEYNVDGDPLLETYTFMARDERLLRSVGTNTSDLNSYDDVAGGRTSTRDGAV